MVAMIFFRDCVAFALFLAVVIQDVATPSIPFETGDHGTEP
jgi:hypothetical protein